MALVVEDGTCVAGANAFVSRANFIAFAALYYPSTTVPDDETTDGAIARSSLWLSTFPVWDGTRACDCGSLLAWPRSGVTDCSGCAIDADVIPEALKQATYIASLAELTTPGVLTPSITPGLQAKREKVDVIEVEYMTAMDQGIYPGRYNPVTALRPVLTQVQDLLKCMAVFPGGPAVPWPFVV
jgi:hypothetical protein